MELVCLVGICVTLVVMAVQDGVLRATAGLGLAILCEIALGDVAYVRFSLAMFCLSYLVGVWLDKIYFPARRQAQGMAALAKLLKSADKLGPALQLPDDKTPH